MRLANRRIVLIGWGVVGVGRRVLLVLGAFISVNIVFDIHLPGRVGLVESGDDVPSERFVAPHGDESIAEEVVFSSGVIALDDSE